MADKIRWGILAPGSIANSFAVGLTSVAGAELLACGSRSTERAEAFAEKHKVARAYGSYEQLLGDADIDAIYIASPHTLHCEHTLMALAAGKAVLCEKPFAINAAQVAKMIEAARASKLLLMEAMWTRFLPHVRKVVELIADGAIGPVRMLQADFGFRARWNPEGRLLNPALGGGALMDVGVYCVSLAHMLLGKPREMRSLAHLGATGVDEQAAMVMSHEGGALSVLSTAVQTNTPHEVVIMGEEGSIRIHSSWWRPSKLSLTGGGETRDIDVPAVGNGYNYQAEEFGRLLAAGKTESAIMPLGESLAVMETLDALRAQWGLTYPCE